MEGPKVIVFFPQGAFGPTLNFVRIAQACQRTSSCSENEVPDPDLPPHLSGAV